MEAPNIQLYNLFRQDLNLPDCKSLELMHLLDKEYKSGVKEDIAALGRLMDARFDQIDDRLSANDKRFDAIDKRFEAQDKRFEVQDNKIDKGFSLLDNKIDKSFSFLDSKMDKGFSLLDNKIDLKTAELHADIHKANNTILMWIIGLIGALLLLFISATWFKK